MLPGLDGLEVAKALKTYARTKSVPIVMLTHEAVAGDMRRSLQRINALDVVAQDTVCIRVEGTED